MSKITFLIIVLIFTNINSFGQKFLTRTQIDEWPKSGQVYVPNSYNRVSSYLYILNKQQYLDIFNGVSYSKEDRKKLGIKKNDKPDLLQMSIDIKHPSISDNIPFTIPLFLFDFRDKNATTTFSNFNGMILNDVKASDLNYNIMGSINVNALISNASEIFWKDVAKIAANLAKSATSIALGNPQGITDLTKKLAGYLDEGIKEIDKLSDGNRSENHSFFVTLVDRESSTEFDEIVTSVRLYQIHWSISNSVQNVDIFSEIELDGENLPTQFESSVITKDYPLVLVVETRSRTKIDKGNPVFTTDYKNDIENEYENYPLEEWPVFKAYNRNFNTAFNAYNYVNSFNNTVNTSDIDWNSLVNAMDYSYQYKIRVNSENSKYSSPSYNEEFKNRYAIIKSRYETVDHMVNELYRNSQRNIHLERSDKIIEALLFPKELTESIHVIYGQIVILNNYDIIISNIAADASNFISNESYQKNKQLKESYEKELFTKLNQDIPSSNEAKIFFYENIIRKYNTCEKCISKSISISQLILNETLQVLLDEYNSLSSNQFNEFNNCRKLIETDLLNIKTKADTTLDNFEKRLANKSLVALENGLKLWKDNIGKESINATSEQLGLWTVAILESRRSIKKSFVDLKNKGLVSIEITCITE